MAKEIQLRDVHVERYYPSVLVPAQEFKTIAEMENPEFAAVWERFWKWHLNTFVYDLDREGAARWEDMLGLRPKAADSLDDRRAEILVRINATLPYTHRRLEQILNALCGQGLYEIDLDYNQYNLAILTNPDITLGINRILTVLRANVPANLTLDIVLQILHSIKIKCSAQTTGIVDARYCFWNRGAATFVRRDAQYKRNGAVRRNKLDPDAYYRQRQYLAASILEKNFVCHSVKLNHLAAITGKNNANITLPINHSAETVSCAESKFSVINQTQGKITEQINAIHNTNCRVVNLRNKTHARDGTHKRNGRYTQEKFINQLCTVRTVENGVPGRVERL